METAASRRGRPPQGWGVPIGVGIGASVGVIAGMLLDQLALGVSFGASFGLVTGLILTTGGSVAPGRRRAVMGTAIGILIAGALVSILIMRQ